MRTVSIDAFPSDVVSTVLTVGNFDGIHRGHQRLVREVVSRAAARGSSSVVVTFEPHTRAVLWPGTSLQVLTTLDEKSAILERMGVEYLVWIGFDASHAGMPG